MISAISTADVMHMVRGPAYELLPILHHPDGFRNSDLHCCSIEDSALLDSCPSLCSYRIDRGVETGIDRYADAISCWISYRRAAVCSLFGNAFPDNPEAWEIGLPGDRRMSGHTLQTFVATFRGYRMLQSSGLSTLMLDNCMKSVISKSDQNRFNRNV